MRRRILYLTLGLIATVALAKPSSAVDNRSFAVHLVGSEETPPNNSMAQGEATFLISRDGMSINFRVIVSHIENVRASHIHIAAPGVAGPIVVPLFLGPTISGPFNGVLAQGSFSAADLTGPLAGQPLSALIEYMNSGGAYVNVHTDQIPSGEIRGQFK